MKVPFVNLKDQYLSIKDEIDSAIENVLDNTAFILGDNVQNFEENFAKFCNAKYAIGINSGTAALHLSLLANNIVPGDEVITAPNSFFATAESISHTGATPVFVDIEESFYTMNPSKIESAITEKTKAIIPIHLYGQPADMAPIMEIAEKHNLKIIEDACQAHGAEYNRKKVPISDIACFSFYPAKNLGAWGEGGMIVTNNEEIANKIKLLRAHGESPKNIHSLIGYNYRMEGIQGAVLNIKLNHLEKWNELRRKNAKLYNKLLKDTDLILPLEKEYVKHVYHLYVIQARDRNNLMNFLKNKEIMTSIHYPIPIHLQKAYLYLRHSIGSFPITENCVNKILSLPMYPELTKDQIKYVCENIKEFYNKI